MAAHPFRAGDPSPPGEIARLEAAPGFEPGITDLQSTPGSDWVPNSARSRLQPAQLAQFLRRSRHPVGHPANERSTSIRMLSRCECPDAPRPTSAPIATRSSDRTATEGIRSHAPPSDATDLHWATPFVASGDHVAALTRLQRELTSRGDSLPRSWTPCSCPRTPGELTVWGVVNGLTSVAKQMPYAEERAKLQRVAGELLAVR